MTYYWSLPTPMMQITLLTMVSHNLWNAEKLQQVKSVFRKLPVSDILQSSFRILPLPTKKQCC